MRVYVDPVPAGLSQAMWRVARVLRETAPAGVQIVDSPLLADLQVIHLIGVDGMQHVSSPSYAALQYCFSAEATADGRNAPTACDSAWMPIWRDAVAVWSYYDLPVPPGINFYHAPLGVNSDIFKMTPAWPQRDIMMLSSGYVSGAGAEAIEACAVAVSRCGGMTAHIGPSRVQGMSQYPEHWYSVMGVTDEDLAGLYRRSLWVSGLRYREGFELPVLEGLACGARPIVFDRQDMRQWYDGHAVFVPECDGDALIDHLTIVLRNDPEPVTVEERAWIVRRFNWQALAAGFWAKIQARMEAAA